MNEIYDKICLGLTDGGLIWIGSSVGICFSCAEAGIEAGFQYVM